MNKTTNYDLNKLQTTDKVIESITALSENADIIDTTLADLQTQIDQGGGGGGSSYTAGTNIDITNNVISVDGEVGKIITGNQNIWQLNEGIYLVKGSSNLYYNSNEYKYVEPDMSALLFVTISTTSVKPYKLFSLSKIIYGNAKSNGGQANEVELATHKVTTISSSSTDTQYPSAKLLYDQLATKTNSNNVAENFWYGTQAQYDALATKDENTLYLTEGGESGEVYSTNETRIGTWIDGKPLYRKVFTGTFPQVTTNWNWQFKLISLEDLNIEMNIIEYSGTVNPVNKAFQSFPLVRQTSSSSSTVEFVARAYTGTSNGVYGILVYNGLTGYNANEYIVSLLYTKTTD